MTKQEALNHLLPHKGKKVIVSIKKVSASGMTRKMDFYVIEKVSYGNDYLININDKIALIAGYKQDKNDYIIVRGCGMDMVFSVLSNFNYAISELIDGERTKNYSKYFFDAEHYQLI